MNEKKRVKTEANVNKKKKRKNNLNKSKDERWMMDTGEVELQSPMGNPDKGKVK